MKVLFILNHPPYGTEHCFNALRLSGAMTKKSPEVQLTVFLMADSVLSANTGQKTPDGYYNIERMLLADKVLVFWRRVIMTPRAGICCALERAAG